MSSFKPRKMPVIMIASEPRAESESELLAAQN